MKILVTGAAGFIGFHTAARLLRDGHTVIGFDNVNDYYDTSLKEARLSALNRMALPLGNPWQFVRANLTNRDFIHELFATERFDRVIHLAAQAGVQHSVLHPEEYVASNLVGTANILEACRQFPVDHLVYASTSSVYGANQQLPFREDHSADHPLQFYAATKRSNELMAHSYAALFGLPTTGLRFFTVYGPWGRPDMALFIFTKAILDGKPVPLFNHGDHARSFTYIDDVVEGIVRVLHQPPCPDPSFDANHPVPSRSEAPFRIYNIGNERTIPLERYIDALESALGLRAKREFLPAQPGDVHVTAADATALVDAVGFLPQTPVEEGIARFVDWYLRYYDIALERSYSVKV